MKNTTGIKKPAQKPIEVKPGERRFWLVVACFSLGVVWYSILVFLFMSFNLLTNRILIESPAVYDTVLSVGGMAIVFLASALSVPFAVRAFKRLKIQKPLMSAIAFFMTLTFAVGLFGLMIDLLYFVQPSGVYTMLAGCVVVAALLYGIVVRSLKHKLTNAKFLTVTIGVAVVPYVAYVLHRLWVTTLI